MASSMSRARLGAPPCSGPDSAPMAATIAAPRSAPVDVTTRAVKVDALKPWAIVTIMYSSMARAATQSGGAAPSELARKERDCGTQHVERRPTAAHGRQHRAQPGRKGAPAPDLLAEGRRGRGIREIAAEQEMPDVLERALLGELDRRVLPVVEEAFLA